MQVEKKKKRSGILVFIIAFIGIVCALSLFAVVIAGFGTATSEEAPDEGNPDPTTQDQPDKDTPTATPPPDLPALKPTDFHGVCDGIPIRQATEYNRQANKTHPVFFYPEWDKSEIMYVESSDDDFGYQVELVACGSRVSEEWAKTCTYAGGISLIFHEARYRVVIFEARTAQLVDSFSINAYFDSDPKCPGSVSGPTSLKVRKVYAEPDKDKIIAFIDQYAKP